MLFVPGATYQDPSAPYELHSQIGYTTSHNWLVPQGGAGVESVCDQRRPGCSQCSRIWIACPGYRDKLDTLFRDESDTVARRIRKKQGKANHAYPDIASSTTSLPSSDDPSSDKWQPPVLSAPPICLEDIAFNHFVSCYIPHSHFSYLPVLHQRVRHDSALATTALATSLANFSVTTNDPKLMNEARSAYSKALAQTNAALANPLQATEDATLVSVLLLGLFEALAHPGRRFSPDGWRTHLEGALTILQLRGKDQFLSEVGRNLFIQVIVSVRTSSAEQVIKVPPALIELERQARPFIDSMDPRLRFLDILEGFQSLRTAMKFETLVDACEIIPKAFSLDQKVIEVMDSIPESWSKPVLLSMPFGSYSQHRALQLWNSLRMMRIFLNELVWKQIRYSTTPYASVPSNRRILELTARNGESMGHEICATVDMSNPDVEITSAEASMLVWPLAAAGESAMSSDALRALVIERLYWLGRKARLPQALWAAQMLEEGTQLEGWLPMYHLA
ncbi:hypothetical protein NA57DRAFT_60544 [Rhizodiscina lignyota]|uniref:Zn(2)-C6 fungal-type domain-containing protein n=1 Tax=Rhizodiscina lignyota TaxID=1504668 RepID=A0A9P4I6S9_9PEZI|nr:hypothetical protein NA57DRAFT_60544 [Rhizodiscina lignyota]